MRLVTILFLLASLATSGCASRKGQAPVAKPAQSTVASVDKNDPNRIVCERVKVPGTRVTRKACYRQGDLEDAAKGSTIMPHNDVMETTPPEE